jgi:uncharacterized protein (TIGR00251 family)
MAATWYRWDGADLVLRLSIQPRAAKDEIVGRHGDTLKIRLAAPPVDGKANEQLRDFLGRLCDVAKYKVTVLTGENSRKKLVRIAAPRRLPPGIPPLAGH